MRRALTPRAPRALAGSRAGPRVTVEPLNDMATRTPRPWDLPSSAVTPQRAYLNRRQLIAGLGLATVGPLLGGCYLSG